MPLKWRGDVQDQVEVFWKMDNRRSLQKGTGKFWDQVMEDIVITNSGDAMPTKVVAMSRFLKAYCKASWEMLLPWALHTSAAFSQATCKQRKPYSYKQCWTSRYIRKCMVSNTKYYDGINIGKFWCLVGIIRWENLCKPNHYLVGCRPWTILVQGLLHLSISPNGIKTKIPQILASYQ